MPAEPNPRNALVITGLGGLTVLGGVATIWAAFPEAPGLMLLPLGFGAGIFLIGVRRFVKPRRTGEEER